MREERISQSLVCLCCSIAVMSLGVYIFLSVIFGGIPSYYIGLVAGFCVVMIFGLKTKKVPGCKGEYVASRLFIGFFCFYVFGTSLLDKFPSIKERWLLLVIGALLIFAGFLLGIAQYNWVVYLAKQDEE